APSLCLSRTRSLRSPPLFLSELQLAAPDWFDAIFARLKRPPTVTRRVQLKATLEDVAKAAGVHRTTVSLSLRDHPRIPLETRDRVKAVARRLGYKINPLVSALMQSRRSGKPVKHATLAYVTNYATRYGWRPEHHDRPDFFPGAVERAAD